MRPTPLLAAAVASVVLVPAGPAAASCAVDAGPSGSPVVFVGTAESERRGYTRFAVDEVWEGPDLAPDVWVLSGQEQPTWPLSLFSAVGSSGDAEFVAGERYVVGATESFATGACSIAEADAATSEPDAREPIEDGSAGADPPIGPIGQTLWVLGAVGIVGGAVALLRRRRTPAAVETDGPPR